MNEPIRKRQCIHCGEPNGSGARELRPYGPGGSDVCAGCVIDSPARLGVAEKQFAKIVGVKGDVVLDANGVRDPTAEEPFACRSYYVVTDPEQCTPPSGKIVGSVDMRALAIEVGHETIQIAAHERIDLEVGTMPEVLDRVARELGRVPGGT